MTKSKLRTALFVVAASVVPLIAAGCTLYIDSGHGHGDDPPLFPADGGGGYYPPDAGWGDIDADPDDRPDAAWDDIDADPGELPDASWPDIDAEPPPYPAPDASGC